MIKKLLRQQMIEKLTLTEFITNHKKIAENLESLAVYKCSNTVALYYSKDYEVSTVQLILKALKTKQVVLPKVSGDKLIFKVIKSLDDLEKGSYGIMEPKEECISVKVSEIDLIVMPCVAVDMYGSRLGRGKGFYDRTINRNLNSICLCSEAQIINKIPVEEHDVPVNLILTEKRTIQTDGFVLSGTKLAKQIKETVQKEIEQMEQKPKLAVILVGDDPASIKYVNKKQKQCEKYDLLFELIKYPEDISQHYIIQKIKEINELDGITGIIVQLPLPKELNSNVILNTINPKKDVDGLTDANREMLSKGHENLACCTPKGILKLLKSHCISLENKKIVLVGHGFLVGRPLALMLKNRNLDFTVCDDTTINLKEETLKADILITATGVPHLIKKDFVKKGAVIVDSGQEFLFSTYCCHPSLANDNLSGIVLWALLNRYVQSIKTRHTYRFVLIPETIGSITYLFLNKENVKKITGGFILTSTAGPGRQGYKPTFKEDDLIDQIAHQAFKEEGIEFVRHPFDVMGSDERQYSSAGFKIPMGTVTKDKYYDYEYYHTSLDNLDFISAENLIQSFSIYLRIIENLEKNIIYKSLNPCCSPQLGKRNLYPSIGGAQKQTAYDKKVNHSDRLYELEDDKILGGDIDAMEWLMFFIDEDISILEIAKKSGLSIRHLYRVAEILRTHKLLEK